VQDDVRASLEDLAIRWETPKGRELKAKIVTDAKKNRGEGIAEILKDFLYVTEVAHGRDLRCITLEGEDLSDAIFGKSDLSWCSLARSTLARADLRSASLKRADLTDADLSLARLDYADCARADFSRSRLDGTHFKEARATGAVFEGSDASRASFDSAQLTKCNFRSAKLEQANFFNADVNNSNFDGQALDKVAARPAKAWGLRFDMDKEEFERQVGLNAITSRTTKRFKQLDALLKLSPGPPRVDRDARVGGGAPVFGAQLRGTQKLRPVQDDALPAVNPLLQPQSEREAAAAAGDEATPPPVWSRSGTRSVQRPTVAHDPDRVAGAAGDEGQRPTTAYGPDDGPAPEAEPTPGGGIRRRPPPPPRPVTRKPGTASGTLSVSPGVRADAALATPPAGVTRPTGNAPRPSGTGPALGNPALGNPTGPAPGSNPAGAPRKGPPSATSTASMGRPPLPPKAAPPAPPAPPAYPFAPLDPDAAEPGSDWAKAIGQLMQLKSQITKVVVELGDKSRVVYQTPPPGDAKGP
jgi:uncharacterized protein YjbI with pentapeptide repeats